MASISLRASRPTRASIDGSDITAVDYTFLPYQPGPYTEGRVPHHLLPPNPRPYIPPLEFYIIQSLIKHVDSIDMGVVPRRPYDPERNTLLMKALFPTFDQDVPFEDMRHVDPRIWATVIQLYANLPPSFDIYTLPLSDIHLTQLQNIRCTPNFTLITVLDLSGRREFSDQSIDRLGGLTGLAALDLSQTDVSSWGIKKLAMCVGEDDERFLRGPAGLRILSLRGCTNVGEDVKEALIRFPLLSGVDLRGTGAKVVSFAKFQPSEQAFHAALFFPHPALTWIDALLDVFPSSKVFPSSNTPHIIHIDSLAHPYIPVARMKSTSVVDETSIALFPDGKQEVRPSYSFLKREAENGAPKREKGPSQDWNRGGEIMEQLASQMLAAQLVQETHNAAARAQDFYAAGNPPRPHKPRPHQRCDFDGMLYNAGSGISPSVDGGKMTFVRIPPSFDTLPKPRRTRVTSRSKLKRDEEVVTKRIKTRGNADEVNRKKIALKIIGMRSGDPVASAGTNPKGQQIDGILDGPSPQLSLLAADVALPARNPFAAKLSKLGAMRKLPMEPPSSQQNSSRPISHLSTLHFQALPQISRSKPSPNMDTDLGSEPDSSSDAQKRLKKASSNRQSLSKEKTQSKGFDMKMWASKAK